MPPSTHTPFMDRLKRLNIGRERYGTEPMLHLLEMLGYPQELIPTIHVAGTNGKGSVVQMLAAGLRAQGLNVGSMISPHLVHPRERIGLNGAPLHTAQFERYGHRLWQTLEQLVGPFSSEHPEWPTYFEFMVLLGFYTFKHERADVIVMETGLGGRLDATNVVSHPLLTCITSIGFDHMDRLGNTLEEIAREKAGILRAGVPLVLGPTMPEEARLTILDIVKANRVEPLIETTAETLHIQTPMNANGQQEIRNLVSQDVIHLGLLGGYQKDNLATVLAVANTLQRFGVVGDMGAFLAALGPLRHPGRFEYHPEKQMLLDGAHNADGLRKLAEGIAQNFPDRALFWMLAQRNNRPDDGLLQLLQRFAPQTYGIAFTVPDGQDASIFYAPQYLRQRVREGVPDLSRCPVWTASDPASACWFLRRLQAGHASGGAPHREPLCVVAGSLYLVGSVHALGGEGD